MPVGAGMLPTRSPLLERSPKSLPGVGHAGPQLVHGGHGRLSGLAAVLAPVPAMHLLWGQGVLP